MSYKKTIGKDFSRQTFTDQHFRGYYRDCNFFGSIFENCTFDCFLYDCNFKNVTLDSPIVLRFQSHLTSFEGLTLQVDPDCKCKFTAGNLSRNHDIIAEIMRQKSLQLPVEDKAEGLKASELVKNNKDKCWKYFARNIPKSLWRHCDFGFGGKGSILSHAVKAREKYFD